MGIVERRAGAERISRGRIRRVARRWGPVALGPV